MKNTISMLNAGLVIFASLFFGVACASNPCDPKNLGSDQVCRAVVSVIENKKDGSLEFKVFDPNEKKEFVECELCPIEFHEKFEKEHGDKASEHYKQFCRDQSAARVRRGKQPYCLVDSTLLDVSKPVIFGRSLNSDCIWMPVAGSRIKLNPGCLH